MIGQCGVCQIFGRVNDAEFHSSSSLVINVSWNKRSLTCASMSGVRFHSVLCIPCVVNNSELLKLMQQMIVDYIISAEDSLVLAAHINHPVAHCLVCPRSRTVVQKRSLISSPDILECPLHTMISSSRYSPFLLAHQTLIYLSPYFSASSS